MTFCEVPVELLEILFKTEVTRFLVGLAINDPESRRTEGKRRELLESLLRRKLILGLVDWQRVGVESLWANRIAFFNLQAVTAR